MGVNPFPIWLIDLTRTYFIEFRAATIITTKNFTNEHPPGTWRVKQTNKTLNYNNLNIWFQPNYPIKHLRLLDNRNRQNAPRECLITCNNNKHWYDFFGSLSRTRTHTHVTWTRKRTNTELGEVIKCIKYGVD